MKLPVRLQNLLLRLPPVDFSAGQRDDHWRGLRMSAMFQVAVSNSQTDDEFEDCFLRVCGAFGHLEREQWRSWLHNYLLPYLVPGELTPRPRTLAQRFLKQAPRRYQINPEFYAQHLASYASSAAENQARLARLREAYNLEIVWRDPLAGLQDADRYQVQEPDRIQFAFFVPTLAAQLSLYPADLVEKANFWRLILCDGLRYDNQPLRGQAVYGHKAILLNMAGGYIRESSCTLIHHEFFHMVDRFALDLPEEDAELTRLNAPSFRYGRVDKDGDALALTEDLPGFLTAYATTNTREDKAELFGHMMVNHVLAGRQSRPDETPPALHLPHS